MSNKSLMINCIESQYTQPYIANVFWGQAIAKVSSITLIPYIKNAEIYNIAYINIDEWCETEAAYNFIKRLKSVEKEARLVYDEDNWWPVQLNTHNNGELSVGDYTVSFESDYWVKNEVSSVSCSYDETCSLTEDDEERPIKGLNGEYYTVEEAYNRVCVLNQQYEQAFDWRTYEEDLPLLKIEDELLHFENELRIHEAVNKSSNVTQRAVKLGERKYSSQLEDEYFSHPVCVMPGSEESYSLMSSLAVRSNA